MQKDAIKISLMDLMVLVAISAVTTLLINQASRCNYSPREFARTLDYNSAAIVMVISSFGIFVFPVLFSTAGFMINRKTNLKLKRVFSAYLFVMAFFSAPISLLIARACAFAIGG